MMGSRNRHVYTRPLTVQSAQLRKHSQTLAGLTIHIGQNKFRAEIAEHFSVVALKKILSVLQQL